MRKKATKEWMIEIKGKVNTAICYARVIEDEAIEQIRRMCDYAMTDGFRIRIMPDVHAGKGCTIGTTMTITDKAVPNVVACPSWFKVPPAKVVCGNTAPKVRILPQTLI